MLVWYSAYERVPFTAINTAVESLGYITSLLRLFCRLQCALFAAWQLPQAAKFAVPCLPFCLRCGLALSFATGIKVAEAAV